MKLLAYARVSTREQNLDVQIDQIKKYCVFKGYEYVLFSEKVSAVKERPEFEKVLKALEDPQYDGLIVTSLDRLGRSVLDLSRIANHIIEELHKKIIFIDQNIDTSTINGKLQFNFLSSIAEWERGTIRERLEAGKKFSGRYGGRNRKKLPMEAIIEHYKRGASYNYLAKMFNVSRSTLYKRFKEHGIVVKHIDRSGENERDELGKGNQAEGEKDILQGDRPPASS